MRKLKLVFDTNYFLHFKFIDEIPWNDIFEEKFSSINAILIPPVLEELDNHKYSDRPKIKERALKISKRFKDSLLSNQSKPLKNNVHCEYLFFDWGDESLNNKNIDDRIITYCNRIQKGLKNNEELIVVSHDINLLLKLKSCNIKYLDPDEKFKLPNEKSKEEKELESIKKELSSFQNRLPCLAIKDLQQRDEIIFNLTEIKLLSEEEKDAKLEKIKNQYPKYQPSEDQPSRKKDPNNLLSGLEFFHISPESWKDYNLKLDSFYKRYHTYLEDLNRSNDVKSRTLEVDLAVFNNGTAPANNIDIWMHITVSKEVKLLDEQAYASLFATFLEKPFPPDKPKNIIEMMASTHDNMFPNLGAASLMRNHFQNIEPINVSKPKIKPTNSYDVEVSAENIKHHLSEKIPKMYLIFPNKIDVKSFIIEFRLICDELPNPIKGVVKYNFVNS